jgi:hypothetical protein
VRDPPSQHTSQSAQQSMGNCQAAEVATVLLQHPGGRVERLYWSTSAAEVMRANPGHYVALVTLRVAEDRQDAPGGQRRTVRLTRVKLLKPKETLLLGHVYRLITTQGASSVRTVKIIPPRGGPVQYVCPAANLRVNDRL